MKKVDEGEILFSLSLNIPQKGMNRSHLNEARSIELCHKNREIAVTRAYRGWVTKSYHIFFSLQDSIGRKESVLDLLFD